MEAASRRGKSGESCVSFLIKPGQSKIVSRAHRERFVLWPSSASSGPGAAKLPLKSGAQRRGPSQEWNTIGRSGPKEARVQLVFYLLENFVPTLKCGASGR